MSPTYDEPRGAIGGGVLAQVVMPAHPAPRRGVGPCGGVVGDHRDDAVHLDVIEGVGQPDDRQRAAQAAAVELQICIHAATVPRG